MLTYEWPSLVPGATRLIVVRSELADDAVAGMELTNTTTLTDAAGYFNSATHTATVRSSGTDPSAGKLTVKLTTIRRILAGSRLQSTISVANGARGDAENVTVVLDGPARVNLIPSQTIPPPSRTEQVEGAPRWTWVFPRLKGPGNLSIKTRHQIPDDVPGGTILEFAVSVSAADGRTDSTSATVEVRN
jgi:hypothetical protein